MLAWVTSIRRLALRADFANPQTCGWNRRGSRLFNGDVDVDDIAVF